MAKFKLFKSADSGDPVVGRQLGNFRVAERMAEGSLGSIYKAVENDSGKEVAFKFIDLDRLDLDPRSFAESVDRLMREISKVIRARHSNIVQSYGVRHEGDYLYIVMEYLRGLDLQSRSQQQSALSYLEICRMALQVVDALDYQWRYNHQPHGDLKPRNIMYADQTNVKLLDFGLAKAVLGKANIQIDAQGNPIGPMQYLAPEQHVGTLPMDPRTDIFSLGVILCEQFTFRTPFKGNTFDELYDAKRKDFTFEIEKYAPNLPMSVVEMVYGMLEPKPARRLADYETITDTLTRAIVELESQDANKGQKNLNPDRTVELHVGELERRRQPLRSRGDSPQSTMKSVEELLRERPKTQVPGMHEDPVALLAPGTTVGDYVIGGLLGRGPHGSVFFATQGKAKVPVVLKFLNRPPRREPEAWSGDLLEKGYRLTMLNHRAVASLKSIEHFAPYTYIVSEPYLGPNERPMTLLDYVQSYGDERGRLNEPMAQWFGLVMLEALDYTHKVGIVHGNLKPENILFHCVGEEGEEISVHMMLTDFSLRRIMDLEPAKGPGTDMPGVSESVCLSPEQRHDGEEATPESDLFSVGAILLRCLTGSDVLPPGKLPSELRQGLNPSWDPVLAKAMSTDPYRRYRSAEEMALVLEGLPVNSDDDDV